MSNWLRRPLSSGEVVGYLLLVAGIVVLAARGVFSDDWVKLAGALMFVGGAVAGRAGSGSRG